MNKNLKQQIIDTKNELECIQKIVDENRTNILTMFLIKYGIIKTTSTIEKVYKNILFNNITSTKNIYTNNFLYKKIIKNPSNPNMDNIYKDLNICDDTLVKKFKIYFKNKTHHIEHLNTLVKHRNSIAHGEDISSGITIKEVFEYYKSAVIIVLYIDLIFKKTCRKYIKIY